MPIYDVSDAGVMTLAGHDVRDLVVEYGSPLIVLVEDDIRSRCRQYRGEMAGLYPRTRVHYAGKAFLTTGFCRLIQEEGLGLDVVSWGELETALAAGFPPEHILMHGNAKTYRDLERALEVGVGRIVVDNLSEIERLAELTERMETTAKVMLRIAPGVKPSTHAYIQTGQIDSKFGFNLNGGDADLAVQRVMEFPRLELVGIHCHIGSQIFDQDPYALAVDAMVGLYAKIQKEYGVPIDELNMGGGLGVLYEKRYGGSGIEEHVSMLCRDVLDAAKKYDVEPPLLYHEPGRSIVAHAGVTLYTVQSLKKIEGIRNYLSVDGGMTDNPRFALYQAKHPVVAAEHMNDKADVVWSISGRCCESGDMLQRDVLLPDLKPGDLIAFLSTGAYTYSMASHYNRVAKPAVLLVSPGRCGLLAARDTVEDLIRLDRIPSWLEEVTDSKL